MGDRAATLIPRILAGQSRAVRLFVKRYRLAFGHYAAIMCGGTEAAATAMTEAFIWALQRLATVDPSQVRPWFFRVLTERCDHVPETQGPSENPERPAASSYRGDDHGLDAEVVSCVGMALRGLSTEQRTAFVLKVVEGFTYREMADLLGLGIDALKMRVYRARRAVRSQIIACCQAITPAALDQSKPPDVIDHWLDRAVDAYSRSVAEPGATVDRAVVATLGKREDLLARPIGWRWLVMPTRVMIRPVWALVVMVLALVAAWWLL